MRKLLISAAAIAMLTTPALAQQQSQGQQTTAKNSAGAAINQNFESPPGDQRIETTPGVYAPGMDAGTNNCAVSMSGGGSVTGFGISLGATWESEDCNERNWIALMSARGWDDVAKSYACLHNAKAAMAFEAAGYDCPDAPGVGERKAAEDQVSRNETGGEPAMPSYCSDGGMANDATIRENCPKSVADRILSDRGW